LPFDWHNGGVAKLRHGIQHFSPAARTAQNRKTDASIGDHQAMANQATAADTKPDPSRYNDEAVG
jgi:hypothetical protein